MSFNHSEEIFAEHDKYSMKRIGIIYLITNLVNGKVYVGRCLKDLDTYLGGGIYIKAAVRKYGKENFSRIVIERCEENLLNEREKFWIAKFDSQNHEKGYNLSSGGEDGSSFAAYIDNIRGKCFEEIYGEKRANEIRRKISESSSFKCKSDSHRRNLSIAKTGKKWTENQRNAITRGMIGHLVTEETKQKLRDSNIGKKQKHSVPVEVVVKETGEKLYFNNTTHAARELKVSFYVIKNNSHEAYNFKRIFP